MRARGDMLKEIMERGEEQKVGGRGPLTVDRWLLAVGSPALAAKKQLSGQLQPHASHLHSAACHPERLRGSLIVLPVPLLPRCLRRATQVIQAQAAVRGHLARKKVRAMRESQAGGGGPADAGPAQPPASPAPEPIAEAAAEVEAPPVNAVASVESDRAAYGEEHEEAARRIQAIQRGRIARQQVRL